MAEFASALSAAVAGAGLLLVAVRVLPRLAVFDEAIERSSHRGQAIRGLGIVLVGGWLAALPLLQPELPLIGLLIGPVAAAVVGFSDDWASGVPPVMRFVAMSVIGLVMTADLADYVGVDPLYWIPLGGIWIVYFTNAFNFMDGIDGISAGTVVVASVAYALVADREGATAVLELCIVLAVLGAVFGAVNIAGSGRFLGDAGSYFFGAALGAIALVTYFGTVSQAAAAGPLTIYVADTGVAIINKVRRGEPIWRPHRLHVYQRIVDAGWSHTASTTLVVGFTALCSVIGVAASGSDPLAQEVAIPALVAVAVAYLATPRLIHGPAPQARETSLG